MRLSKPYRLSGPDALRVRMKMGKGCFVLGCLIPIGMIVSIAVRGYFPAEGRWIVTLVVVLVILLIFQLFLREAAMVRLEIGREYAAQGAHENVVAALEPFAYPGSRIFDRSGEANYLLGFSAKKIGESEFATHCLKYAANAKTGEWAEKAKELLP